jgi:hypothetical protein
LAASLSTPGAGETQTSASGLSPIIASCFWRESNEYPLKEKLKVLIEIVDSVRLGLLQTSVLINYIADFMQKNIIEDYKTIPYIQLLVSSFHYLDWMF